MTTSRALAITLVCTYPTDRSHLILEAAPAPADGRQPEWAPVAREAMRVSIRVQEHGVERIFVAATDNLGSTRLLS